MTTLYENKKLRKVGVMLKKRYGYVSVAGHLFVITAGGTLTEITHVNNAFSLAPIAVDLLMFAGEVVEVIRHNEPAAGHSVFLCPAAFIHGAEMRCAI